MRGIGLRAERIAARRLFGAGSVATNGYSRAAHADAPPHGDPCADRAAHTAPDDASHTAAWYESGTRRDGHAEYPAANSGSRHACPTDRDRRTQTHHCDPDAGDGARSRVPTRLRLGTGWFG